MTTEKFFCDACTCVCYLSVSFTSGDEKTKSFLVCPLQMKKHNFNICDKLPERAEIRVRGQLTTNQQFLALKKLMKSCVECVHNKEDEYCFKNCYAFSQHEEESLELIYKTHRKES